MRRLSIFVIALSLVSLSCGLFTPASNPDPQPAAVTETVLAPATFPLTLNYLYMGQPDRAQTEFTSRYSGLETDAKWAEILKAVHGSLL